MIKRNYYAVLQGKAVGIASRAEGMAYLLDNFHPHSESNKPYEMAGVALIMEDIAHRANELSEMLQRPPALDTEIELTDEQNRI